MAARVGIEPTNGGFKGPCLTAWLPGIVVGHCGNACKLYTIKGNSSIMIFHAIVTEKTQLNRRTIRFVFTMPKDMVLVFDPGQYLMVEVGDIRRRPYSIASSADDQSKFTLLVDTSPQGIGSKFFESLEINQAVKMQGPFGLYALESGVTSYLFIAAGVGIAPFIPMIHALAKSGFKGSIRFVQGARNAADLLHAEEFEQFQRTHSNFEWVQALSGEETNQSFHGRTSKWISEQYAYNPNELVYLCGSPEMVRDCRAELLQKGLQPQQLKIEIFS